MITTVKLLHIPSATVIVDSYCCPYYIDKKLIKIDTKKKKIILNEKRITALCYINGFPDLLILRDETELCHACKKILLDELEILEILEEE